jgi:hypothetical protein
MCLINGNTFDMMYINDLTANFRPSTVTAVSSGSATLLASDNNELLKFLDQRKCVSVPTGCYSYCRDTCFRTLRVSVTGANAPNYKLKVCVRNSSPENCILYRGGARAGNTYTIMAHVPVGLLYNAVVIDGTTGKTIVPTTQEAYYEENFCGTTSRFDVALIGQVGAIPFVTWT